MDGSIPSGQECSTAISIRCGESVYSLGLVVSLGLDDRIAMDMFSACDGYGMQVITTLTFVQTDLRRSRECSEVL